MTTQKVLLFSLFGFTLLASFFFAFSESQPSVHPRVLLGRRNLLSNKDLEVKNVDEDDFLGEVVPRKKKALTSNDDDDNDLVAKKKSSETNIKKKKSPPSSETKKKSSSISNEDDKQVEKKKKKSSSISNEDEKQVEKKKKSSSPSSSSSSSLSSSSSKNQTKIIKPKITSNLESNSSKNKTKLTKPTSKKVDDSSSNTPTITKSKLSKVNSTSKSSNDKSQGRPKSSPSDKPDGKDSSKQKSQNQNQKPKPNKSPSGWTYQPDEDEEDLVSEFRHLPTKFHQSFIPDLHRISTTSKIYLNKYNKEITKGFKPYFGNKYAPTIAASISFLFILLPLLLVSLVFNRIKAYFSLQKLIIFIQIYLSIYFSILCFSSLITGLEPLRFFYSTSQETYLWLQVLQTLAYVLYLLLLLMYLVLVFSTESGLGQKFLGLAQTFVGFAVGLHYYMTVFHRVVLRQPPKSSWKIHGIYATCFLVICLFAGAERRKKVYLVEGSEEGKTS